MFYFCIKSSPIIFNQSLFYPTYHPSCYLSFSLFFPSEPFFPLLQQVTSPSSSEASLLSYDTNQEELIINNQEKYIKLYIIYYYSFFFQSPSEFSGKERAPDPFCLCLLIRGLQVTLREPPD